VTDTPGSGFAYVYRPESLQYPITPSRIDTISCRTVSPERSPPTKAAALLALAFTALPAAAEEYAPPARAEALAHVRGILRETVAAGEKIEAAIPLFGSVQKVRLLKADAKGITLRFQASAIDLTWAMVTPEQAAGLGLAVAAGKADRALAVADLCLAAGLPRRAEEALRLAASGGASVADAVAARRKHLDALKAAAAPPPRPKPAARPRTPARPREPRTWRPFAPDSPWNTMIPKDAEVDPQSKALIEDLATSSQWNFLGVNIKGFSIPVYFVDSAKTPKVTVTCRDVAGKGFDQPLPMPPDARPDPQSDRHLCIVDRRLGMEWGMWDARRNADGSWMCGVGAAFDLKGSGVHPPHGRASPWQHAHGARASGFPLIAGLILVDEVKAGRIEHALAFAYPHCRSRYFIHPPASTAQGTTNEARPDRGIPMGGLIQLDPAIDVASLKLSRSGTAIARALQEYGAYVCDYSGAINLYADGSPAAQAAWDAGLLETYELRRIFDADMLRRFRVIKMGPLIDNKN
jgi:hypothetical protein